MRLKDELKVIDGLPNSDEATEEEKKYIKTESYDELVFSDDKAGTAEAKADSESADNPEPAADVRPSEYYLNAKGLDDFIIGYQAPVDDEPVPYLTSAEKAKTNDSDFVVGYGDNSQKASQEPQPEPVAEAKPEPVVEAKPEPVVETKPEPVVEAKPEPAVNRRPVQKAQPAPVKKSRSDVADLLDELDSKI